MKRIKYVHARRKQQKEKLITTSYLTSALRLLSGAIFIIIFAMIALPSTVNYARASEDPYDIAANAPVGELILGRLTHPNAPETIENKIKRITAHYGVSYERVSKTIACENHDLDTNLQSRLKYTFDDPKRGIVKGEREKSFGLVMIHLPDHADISLAEATNPDFAIEWMVKEWSKGNKGMWSCARILGYTQ